MSADGLTSSRMCQILKAILSNFFLFLFFFQSKFYDHLNKFTMELGFPFNAHFLFSCCSSLLLLQGEGLFPKKCQFSSVGYGLLTSKALVQSSPLLQILMIVTPLFILFSSEWCPIVLFYSR